MKKKLLNVGISDVKHSILHFILLMSNNPVKAHETEEVPVIAGNR
jgi:hypothetical protein